MVTRSLEVPQGPLSQVHCSTVMPSPSPLTAVAGSVGAAMAALPLTTCQKQAPGAIGDEALSCAVPGQCPTVWSGPASAAGMALL